MYEREEALKKSGGGREVVKIESPNHRHPGQSPASQSPTSQQTPVSIPTDRQIDRQTDRAFYFTPLLRNPTFSLFEKVGLLEHGSLFYLMVDPFTLSVWES